MRTEDDKAIDDLEQLSPILKAFAFAWVLPAVSGQGPQDKLTSDELLVRGRYAEIPVGKDTHGKALRAFAQYYLAPSKAVCDIAMEAQKDGEILGTLVAWRCQKEGIGVRHDEKLMWRHHFELRTHDRQEHIHCVAGLWRCLAWPWGRLSQASPRSRLDLSRSRLSRRGTKANESC